MNFRLISAFIALLQSATVCVGQDRAPLGRTGLGVSYAAVCLLPGNDLDLTKGQIDQIKGLQSEVRKTHDFQIDPNDEFDTQRKKHRENRERRKTVVVETSKAAFSLLSKSQQPRARELKLQLDLHYGLYDAALQQLGVEANDESYEDLRSELAFVPYVVEDKVRKLRRDLTTKSLLKIFTQQQLQEYVGEPFEFRPLEELDARRMQLPQRLLEQPKRQETIRRRK